MSITVRAYQTRVLMVAGHPQTCWMEGGVDVSAAAFGLTDRMALHQAGLTSVTSDWLEEQIGQVVHAATQVACAAGIDLERALERALSRAQGRHAEAVETAERTSAAFGVDRHAGGPAPEGGVGHRADRRAAS